MPAAGYEDSVFINCPFDETYQPIFRSLVFAVQDCGFLARCALEVEDAGEVRIRKINRIIEQCQYGIHDISRTELDSASRLPRFNMPLELGLFLGAKEFGRGKQRDKQCLILDRERYRYQAYCSDIAGQDIRAHANDPDRAIRAVRDMLASARAGAVLLPGAKKIGQRYQEFQNQLPQMCAPFHLDPDDLRFFELRTLVQEWVDVNRI